MVIGGGAAGLYLASLHPGITILERGEECGRKLILTGGGRCNYTNKAEPEEMAAMFHGNKAFIKRVLYAHTSKDIIRHFRELGIKPLEEDSGRIFPSHGDAKDIRAALLSRGAEIMYGKAEAITRRTDGTFAVRTENRELTARRVVVATGGDSFPATGSDGSGYRLLQELGHSIATPHPALAPISMTPALPEAEGITIKATLRTGKAEEHGDIIITRRGISGPAALNISRHLAENDEIEICFARIDKESLRMGNGAKTARNALPVPPHLAEALLGPLADRRCSNLSRKELSEIDCQLSRFRAKAKAMKAGAMNTRGGVATAEINPMTMESRIVRNLFIAGDLIDVDGRCGGYSLSFAFATAYIIHKALDA